MQATDNKKKKYTSNRMVFLTLDIGKGGKRWHNILIAEIAEALYKLGHHTIWYDHIKEIVPKTPLPNTINGRRWDIAVKVGERRYALIEILMMTEPEEKIQLEAAGEGEDGESESKNTTE